MRLTRMCSSLNGGMAAKVLGMEGVHLLDARVCPADFEVENARCLDLLVRASLRQIHRGNLPSPPWAKMLAGIRSTALRTSDYGMGR